MKVSGFILVALALVYLYLWRSGHLGAITPAQVPQAHVTPEHRLQKAAP